MTEKPAWHPDRLAARLPYLRRRQHVAVAIRAFFTARDYMEVETPIAVACPGEEVHVRCFATTRYGTDGAPAPLWLHTSPEFAMKKLLAGGAGPIFQLARVFRNNEGSDLHHPEFTMLEWYRPGASLQNLIAETAALLRATLPPTISRAGQEISTETYEILSVAESFSRYLQADLLACGEDAQALADACGHQLRDNETWEDFFFRMLLSYIEPELGFLKPCFLTHWPAAQAALAKRDSNDPRVALRFELFIAGIEIANAFEELTDPAEQRARFIADRARRHAERGPDWDLDEDFLAALAQPMPAASGIALGFDRLVMLASNARRIEDVLWLPA
jgi:lysyl-tRNA synthetase class 2